VTPVNEKKLLFFNHMCIDLNFSCVSICIFFITDTKLSHWLQNRFWNCKQIFDWL